MIDCCQPASVERRILEAFGKAAFSDAVGVAVSSRRNPKPTFLGCDWWDVDTADVLKQSYFAFDFSNDEAAYYCPLMMWSCLRAGGKGHQDYFDRFFFLADETKDGWNPNPGVRKAANLERKEFRLRFTTKQSAAISCFFNFLAGLAHEDAVEALREYWHKFLPNGEASD